MITQVWPAEVSVWVCFKSISILELHVAISYFNSISNEFGKDRWSLGCSQLKAKSKELPMTNTSPERQEWPGLESEGCTFPQDSESGLVCFLERTQSVHRPGTATGRSPGNTVAPMRGLAEAFPSLGIQMRWIRGKLEV